MGGRNGTANGGQQVVVHLSRISGRPLVLAISASSNPPSARPDDAGLFERRTCHQRLNDVPSKRFPPRRCKCPPICSLNPDPIYTAWSLAPAYISLRLPFFCPGVSGLSPIAAGRWNLGHYRIILFLALSPCILVTTRCHALDEIRGVG